MPPSQKFLLPSGKTFPQHCADGIIWSARCGMILNSVLLSVRGSSGQCNSEQLEYWMEPRRYPEKTFKVR